MKRNLTVFILTALFASGIPHAAPAVDTLPRAQWLGEMGDLLPALFCQGGTYFRSCFETDAAACHKAASHATASCLEAHRDQIPEILRQPQDGQRWGEKIGTCAGTRYEEAFRSLRIDSESCNNPMEWQ